MVIGYRRFGKRNKEVQKSQFKYVEETNAFVCPMGCILEYATMVVKDIVNTNRIQKTALFVRYIRIAFQRNKTLSLIIYGRNIKISLERIS